MISSSRGRYPAPVAATAGPAPHPPIPRAPRHQLGPRHRPGSRSPTWPSGLAPWPDSRTTPPAKPDTRA